MIKTLITWESIQQSSIISGKENWLGLLGKKEMKLIRICISEKINNLTNTYTTNNYGVHYKRFIIDYILKIDYFDCVLSIKIDCLKRKFSIAYLSRINKVLSYWEESNNLSKEETMWEEASEYEK